MKRSEIQGLSLLTGLIAVSGLIVGISSGGFAQLSQPAVLQSLELRGLEAQTEITDAGSAGLADQAQSGQLQEPTEEAITFPFLDGEAEVLAIALSGQTNLSVNESTRYTATITLTDTVDLLAIEPSEEVPMLVTINLTGNLEVGELSPVDGACNVFLDDGHSECKWLLLLKQGQYAAVGVEAKAIEIGEMAVWTSVFAGYKDLDLGAEDYIPGMIQ